MMARMRKIIVCNIMSFDGYVAGPDNDVMVLPMDQSFNAYNAERLRNADTLLLGRVSYEMFRSYWPERVDAPDADVDEREISKLNNDIEKIVVSDSMAAPEEGPWQNTRVIPRADSRGQIAKIKEGSGREILIFGSHALWNDLLVNDLVDELHMMVGPLTLGGGTRAFEDGSAARFELISSEKLEGSQNILIKYRVLPHAL